jgi:hypothetical protein
MSQMGKVKQLRRRSSFSEPSTQLSSISPHVNEFLFVNRDQASISRGTRSHQVNSHVQVSYRKRSLEKYESSEAIPHEPPSEKTAGSPRKGGTVQPWRASRPPRARKASARGKPSGDERPRSPSPAAKSVIQKGNSDPFAALPFTVDPITNKILSWFRDDGIPAMFPMEKAVLGLSMPATQRKWESAITSIQSPTLSLPYLASVCAMMARRTRSDVIRGVALQLKGKSYTILRTRLSRTGGQDVRETWKMILNMFWAEQNTGCQQAAETHLASLAEYLRHEQPSSLDPDFRMELLAADVILAGMKTGLPLFRGRDWVAEEMYEGWRVEVDNDKSPLLALKFLDIHEAVSDGSLRSILTRLRELVAVAELVASQAIRNYSVYRWMDFRLLSCEADLWALYHEYNNLLAEGKLDKSASSRHSSLNYCACLTALAWTCSTLGSNNRCMEQIMMSRLQSVHLSCGFDELGHDEPSSLALWSFYVGSLLEKMIESETGKSVTKGWHSTKFEMASKEVGGGDWSSISKLLGRFLHSDTLRELNLS